MTTLCWLLIHLPGQARATRHAHSSIRYCQCVELGLKFRSTSDINGQRIADKLSAPTWALVHCSAWNINCPLRLTPIASGRHMPADAITATATWQTRNPCMWLLLLLQAALRDRVTSVPMQAMVGTLRNADRRIASINGNIPGLDCSCLCCHRGYRRRRVGVMVTVQCTVVLARMWVVGLTRAGKFFNCTGSWHSAKRGCALVTSPK